MQESIALRISHHWVSSVLNKPFKSFKVSLLSSNMNRCLTCKIFGERIRLTMLKKSFDNKWVTSNDCLVKSKVFARIDAGLSFLIGHDHVKNIMIFISTVLEEIIHKVVFIKQNINIIVMIFDQLSDSLTLRNIAGVMQRSCYCVWKLIFFSFFVNFIIKVFIHTYEDRLDCSWREHRQNLGILFTDCLGKCFFKLQWKSDRLSNVTDWAIFLILLHFSNQHFNFLFSKVLISLFTCWLNFINHNLIIFLVLSFRFIQISDCNVQRNLALLIKHEHLLWVVFEMLFKLL